MAGDKKHIRGSKQRDRAKLKRRAMTFAKLLYVAYSLEMLRRGYNSLEEQQSQYQTQFNATVQSRTATWAAQQQALQAAARENGIG